MEPATVHHFRKVWLVLLVLALSGCAHVGQVVEKPRLALARVEIVEIGLLQQRYRVTLRAQNPNAIALPVRGISYTIELAGVEFGSGVSSSPIDLPAYGEADIELELSTNLLRLARNLMDRLRDGNTAISYRLSGHLNVDLVGGRRFPFENTGKVDLGVAR